MNDELKNDPFEDEGWELISCKVWEPQAGDTMIGKYDGSELFTEGNIDNEVNKHFIIDKDGERFSFVAGSVFDKTVKASEIKKGDILKVTFQGKKELSGSRTMNLFDIRVKRS